MKIADLIKKKNAKVQIRVPTHLQKELGGKKVTGVVKGLEPNGGITWVRVSVGRGSHLFRPQDLIAA